MRSEAARALAPVLREMTSPLARLFLRATRDTDPVAIHYSQSSIHVDWLIESCPDGSTWVRRFSSYEADHNRMAKARTSYLRALEDLGYSPRFVAGDEIEKGALSSYKVAVLPTSRARNRSWRSRGCTRRSRRRAQRRLERKARRRRGLRADC